MAFTHILVPVDFGGRATRALGVARDLARTTGARITLLHVVEEAPGAGASELRALYRRLSRAAARRLEGLARPFAREHIPVRARIIVGRPAREIIRAITRDRVDLIVMGSHRLRPGKAGQGLGTVSYAVGVTCPCAVLLVK